MTGELKKMAIAMLQEYVKEFQERRKQVTDEVMRGYMTPRELVWKGNPNPVRKEKEKKGKGEKDDAREQKGKEAGKIEEKTGEAKS
jgi:tryptophanyl-tRNA synthetase